MKSHCGLLSFAVAAVIPLSLSAQRVIPRINPTPGRAGTVETGAQPEPVARALAVQRSRVEVESYPFLNFNQGTQTGERGVPTRGYSSVGQGVHVEYRATGNVLGSIDYAQSYAGGPGSTYSLELGARFRTSDFAERVRPYLDVRGVWLQTSNNFGDNIAIDPAYPGANPAYEVESRGYGALAGVGSEFWFARQFAVTVGADAIRTRMSPSNHSIAGTDPFWMNNYRLTLGLKFNQARAVALR